MSHIVKLLNGPKLKAHKTPPTSPIKELIIVDFLRENPCSSQKYEMDISLMDTVEVREARNSRIKKRVDQINPAGSWLKIYGSTSKTSVGPASGDKPKENTAGKIIIPARVATAESNMEVLSAVFARLFLSLK